jgi:putative transcriptional regulator
MMENNRLATSFAPGILIAAPELKDPNFDRSVVLMVQHNEKGAFGLVINRPLETTLAELSAFLKINYQGLSDKPLLLGGPVGLDHMCFIHSSKYRWEETIDVNEEIRLSFGLEGLREISEAGERNLHIFVGSSGWGHLQLENEISAGAWFPRGVTAELVFDTPHDEMWKGAFRSMGLDPFMMPASRTIQ